MTRPRDAQRLDQWLYRARLFKSRALAAKCVADGKVRLTRATAGAPRQTRRATKPSVTVAPGDTITFQRGDRLRVIRIDALASRRGPACEAQSLYTDRSPPPPAREAPGGAQGAPAAPSPGARPTKKERRQLARLRPDAGSD